ncbi:MAG: O-antigen ligase family protein [Crocinitomicaceae bacterium]
MKGISSLVNTKTINILAGIVFLTVLFLPFIKLKPGIPGFEVVDIIIVILGIVVWINRKAYQSKRLFYIILGYAFYVLITIFVNSRFFEVRDYFEIYKLLKFLIIIGLFTLINGKKFIKKWIKPAFVVLVIFNMIHYYDLFYFNDLLENYYQAGKRVSEFGLDSMGHPTDKRLLGFLCNPNYNAITFMFFSIIFIPKYGERLKIRELIFFSIAILMVFLCQSRTELVALAVTLVAYMVPIIRKELKKILLVLGVSAGCFVLSSAIIEASVFSDDSEPIVQNGDMDSEVSDSLENAELNQPLYLETLFDGSAIKSNSLQQRIVIWSLLWEMIKDKPVFGHGPNKEFFYDNKLYAESDYMLVLWRYGFIGLLIHLLIFSYVIYATVRKLNQPFALIAFLYTIVLIMSSLANNPFFHQTLMVLYGIVIGFYLNSMNVKNKSET